MQHRQVGFHLVALTPALDKARFLVQRCVDYVGHIVHLPENLGTACLIREIDREQGCSLKASRDTSGDSNHFPTWELREMLHSGETNKPGRPGDEDFSLWH